MLINNRIMLTASLLLSSSFVSFFSFNIVVLIRLSDKEHLIKYNHITLDMRQASFVCTIKLCIIECTVLKVIFFF